MPRTPSAVLAVATLLVLAGCAAGGGGTAADGGGADATPTPAGPVYELPESGEALSSAHGDALEAAGSFTADTNVTSRDGSTGRAFSVAATTLVDLDAGTVLMRADVGGGTEQAVYVDAEGTAYQQTTTAAGDAVYQRLEAAPDVTTLYRLPVEPLVDEASLSYAGRDEVDGVPVAVYEVTDLDALVTPAGVGGVGAVDASALQSFEVRLMVSADGLVRHLDYRVEVDLDGETRTLEMQITYRDVGSTTVAPPDWLDEAR